MAMIQGHYAEAVSLLEAAMPVMTALLGANSWEVGEARTLMIDWTRCLDPAKALAMSKAMEEEARRQFPLCVHLRSLEDCLLNLGIQNLDPIWRFGRDGKIAVRYIVVSENCSFLDTLRLDQCVTISEWENFRDGRGRDFVCTLHQDSLEMEGAY
jgi:hypothetical protein